MRGRIQDTGHGYSLEFIRHLESPAETVWQMLTQPAKRATWLFDGVIEPREGGRVHLYDSHHTIIGRVTVWRPPHVLALTWNSPDAPRGDVRFELTETSHSSCRLRVVHSTDRAARPRSLAAGWHTMLDRLSVSLGVAAGGDHPGFEDLMDAYLNEPIDPERA